MKTTVHRVDLERFFQSQEMPRCLLDCQLGTKWWIPVSPLVPASTTRWQHAKGTDQLLLPLVPYRTVDAEPVTALGLAAQLGLNAGLFLAGKGYRIAHMHIALGIQIESIQDDQLGTSHIRFHLGFGFQTT